MLRHYIAVDDTETVGDRLLEDGLQQFRSRSCPQVRKGIRSNRGDEIATVSLADVQRLRPEGDHRRESTTAFADGAREQTFRQG